MKRITRSEYVEILIGDNNGKSTFYFPDQPNLRGVSCEALEAYSDIDSNPTLGQNVAVAYDFIRQTFIVLYFEGGEFIKMPLSKFTRFAPDLATGNTIVQQLDSTLLNGQNVVWTKSYIQYNGTAVDISGQSFAFNIHYKTRAK